MNTPQTSIHELLTAAWRAGIRYRAVAGTPARLFVWGATGADADRIADALYRRREEIVARIGEPPGIGEDEPEMLAGDLPIPVLRAMVIGWVYDTLTVIEGERAWEASIVGRDVPPAPPKVRKVPRRERERTDRVRF